MEGEYTRAVLIDRYVQISHLVTHIAMVVKGLLNAEVNLLLCVTHYSLSLLAIKVDLISVEGMVWRFGRKWYTMYQRSRF